MRLIHVDTFELKQFNEPLPSYGILSHTWQEEEIDYQIFTRATVEEIQSDHRYAKIRGCAHIARQQKLEYIWVDTCCIDKSSSAELQEAINSMFRWYERAVTCYVYLEDHEIGKLNLSCTRWVTRGWTLQELIAPVAVLFYAEDWSLIGSKLGNDYDCAKATGIASDILRGSKKLDEVSVAEKMSWAARRQCTRVEDSAYSLMGLFGIYMPMLYGEGESAFIRLQEEIVKTTFDMSIFAWTNQTSDETSYCGLLSPSLVYFQSADIITQISYESESPYSITNLGMQLHAELIALDFEPDLYLLRLVNTGRRSSTLGRNIDTELALHVKRLLPDSKHFARVDPHTLSYWKPWKESKTETIPMYVRQYPILPRTHTTNRQRCLYFVHIAKIFANEQTSGTQHFHIVRVWPRSDWMTAQRTLHITHSAEATRAAIWYSPNETVTDDDTRVILLQFQPSGQRRIFICHNLQRYIPVNTQESAMDSKVIEILEATKSEVNADGNYEYLEDDGGSVLEIWGKLETYLQYGRLSLRARIGESQMWH